MCVLGSGAPAFAPSDTFIYGGRVSPDELSYARHPTVRGLRNGQDEDPEFLASMTDHDRDRSCIARLVAGEEAALEELYDRHGDLLYSLVLRMLRRPADAEEVAQETWVQVWRSARTYDPHRGTVGAWLVTLARSRAIDRIRSEGSRERAITAASREIPDPPPDAARDAAHLELSRRVSDALTKLGDQHRQVLELAYFGGLSQSEIAERLKQPLGTVKSWTRQALLRLGDLVPREEMS